MQIRRQVRPPYGAKARHGVSAVELVVALVLVGVLAGIAIPQMSKHSSRRAAQNARDAFIATASQARAAAIRAGEEVRMQVDPTSGTVLTTLVRDGSTVVEPLDYQAGTIRGDIVGSSGFALCYVARGFARTCGADPDSLLGFASPQGMDTSWVRVTLGRMERR